MLDVKTMIDRIDLLAKSNGLSRHKLLQACGVRSYVDNLQKGQIPKLDTTVKIAEHCNVSVDYLLGRTENPIVNQ